MDATSRLAQRSGPWLLGAWGVGALTHEALCTAAAFSSLALFLMAWLRKEFSWPELRTLLQSTAWPWALFVGLSFLLPLGLGRLPTGTGLARWSDAFLFPAAAWLTRAAPQHALMRAARVVAAVLLASCVAAGFQHYGVWPSESQLEPLRAIGIPVERVYEPAPGQPGHFLAGGLAFHRLKFSHIVGLGVLAAWVAAVASAGRSRWAWGSLAVGGAYAVIAFPSARLAAAALVAAMTWCLIPALGNRKRAWGAALAFLVLGGGVAALQPALRTRLLQSFNEQGNGERLTLWQSGLNAVAQYPVGGVGLGRFQPARFLAEEVASDAVRSNRGKSHNQWLSIAAEAGIASALAFLIYLGSVLGRFRGAGGVKAWVQGALLFFGALSLAHDPLFQPVFSMVWFGSLGVAVGLQSRVGVSTPNARA